MARTKSARRKVQDGLKGQLSQRIAAGQANDLQMDLGFVTQPTVAFLRTPGEDLWSVTPQGTATAVISIDDLAEAVLRSSSVEALGSPPPVNPGTEVAEYIDRNGLRSAIERSEMLLKDVFGPQAYVRPVFDIDPDTGEQELVIEAHYGFDPSVKAENELFALHDAFMARYLREIEFPVRPNPTLLWVPSDADHS